MALAFIKKPVGEYNETLPCPDCGRPMVLRQAGETDRFFFACSRSGTCGTTWNAHQDGSPDGPPVDSETRAARKTLRAMWDVLCKKAEPGKKQDSEFERRVEEATDWLARRMGVHAVQVKFKEFNVDQCREAMRLIEHVLQVRKAKLESANAK